VGGEVAAPAADVRASIRIGIVAAAGVWVAAAIAVSARGQSVLDGVFTDEQATRGADVYAATCGRCHGKQLEGGEEAPALAGQNFMSSWKGSTVGDLVSRARRTMPDDDPGSLTLQQYTDVVAYVLRQNHYPAGKTELPVEIEKQKLIKFEAIK
jgi:S-disulfanyl-L-cysteine oxidoreductase SoxD